MNIKEIIDDMRPYIKTSAENAAKVFEISNFSHRLFEGTKTLLSPAMCEQIYTDMISEVLNKKIVFCQKYGLVTIVIPKRKNEDEEIEFDIELGMIFPSKEQAKDSQNGRVT
jgi:hypothetical protein